MGSQRLRIGMINHFMPQVGRKHGGVVQFAHNLADGLVRRGHQVNVWTYTLEPEGAHYTTSLLPGRRFVQSWLGLRLTHGLLGNLFFCLPSYKDVDVLLAHGDTALLGLKNRRVVRVMHGSALGEAFSASNPLRFLSQILIYLQELGSAMLQPYTVGVSRNTSRSNPFVRRWIHNGIDTVRFCPKPEVLSQYPSILFVGTLGGRKRGNFLLDVFQREIQPHFPDAVLEMVSEEGPPIHGVRYHTGISEELLIGLYQQSWVFASPSRYEGFGLPYVEAMACGTPVLATHNPGSREVTQNGKFGILARDHEFGCRLRGLLNEEKLRTRLLEKGLHRASELSLERMLDQYEALFREIAKKNG